MIRTILFALLVLLATRASAAPALIAAYNETAQPELGTYWPYSVGWLWQAPVSFELTRIETRFSSGLKTVGIEVYDNLPHLGGLLLASSSYVAVGGTWGGADVGPVALTAGEDYLIGFTNVENLGASFSGFGSTLFSSDGLAPLQKRLDAAGVLRDVLQRTSECDYSNLRSA